MNRTINLTKRLHRLHARGFLSEKVKRRALTFAAAVCACSTAVATIGATAHPSITTQLDTLKHACARGDARACRQYNQIATEIESKLPDRRTNHDADILLEKARNGTLPDGPKDISTEIQEWKRAHTPPPTSKELALKAALKDPALAHFAKFRDICNYTSSSDPGHTEACQERDAAAQKIKARLNICYGATESDEYHSAYGWFFCDQPPKLKEIPTADLDEARKDPAFNDLVSGTDTCNPADSNDAGLCRMRDTAAQTMKSRFNLCFHEGQWFYCDQPPDQNGLITIAKR